MHHDRGDDGEDAGDGRPDAATGDSFVGGRGGGDGGGCLGDCGHARLDVRDRQVETSFIFDDRGEFICERWTPEFGHQSVDPGVVHGHFLWEGDGISDSPIGPYRQSSEAGGNVVHLHPIGVQVQNLRNSIRNTLFDLVAGQVCSVTCINLHFHRSRNHDESRRLTLLLLAHGNTTGNTSLHCMQDSSLDLAHGTVVRAERAGGGGRGAHDVVPDELEQVIQAWICIRGNCVQQLLVVGLGALMDAVAGDCETGTLGVVHDLAGWHRQLHEIVPKCFQSVRHRGFLDAALALQVVSDLGNLAEVAPNVLALVLGADAGLGVDLRRDLQRVDLEAASERVAQGGEVDLGGHQEEGVLVLLLLEVVLERGAAEQVASSSLVVDIAVGWLVSLREHGPIGKGVVVVDDVVEEGVTFSANVWELDRIS
mmetsp:Transcript_76665/g.167469  ORF Transcript_76665/g.167469 Transcript_76665/m.167469 type:complete len:424 (-) Transcript_76665:260-1531(-)